MTHSDAGRLGAEKTKIILENWRKQNIENYNKNPNRCIECGTPLDYDHRTNTFCSQSCSAKFNHRKRANEGWVSPLKKQANKCLFCGKPIPHGNNLYCSLICFTRAKWKIRKNNIEKTGIFPFNNLNETNRRIVRKYLEEKFGHICAICGKSEWNGKPITLIVDHIDGDATNHAVNNFRLICPNCDSQTDTYKFKHRRKSSRLWRQKYIKHKTNPKPE